MVLSVVLIVVGIGWALSRLEPLVPLQSLKPVPTVIPPATGEPIPAIDINASGRTSTQLHDWATPIAEETNISVQALAAYANASLIAAESWPECHLHWNTLAGIGFIETRHGTYSGNFFQAQELNDQGMALPPIIGVPLDGSPGFAEIRDTDEGRLDGDKVYDRAVGPMQFIPSTWGQFGRDADGDGVANPNSIDDAALAAANLLCSQGDLATETGWNTAIRAYNNSQKYVNDVRNAAASYALRQPAFRLD